MSDDGNGRGRWCLEHTRRMDEHERRIETHDTRLGRIESAMFGDAGRLGAMARISRVEELISENRKARAWLIAAVVTALINVLASLALLQFGS